MKGQTENRRDGKQQEGSGCISEHQVSVSRNQWISEGHCGSFRRFGNYSGRGHKTVLKKLVEIQASVAKCFRLLPSRLWLRKECSRCLASQPCASVPLSAVGKLGSEGKVKNQEADFGV